MPTIRTEPTPNPNSLKFSTDAGSFLDGGIATFASPDEAEGDPLARRLFDAGGVDDVFVTPQFVTVSKTESADWAELSPQIESILSDFLEGR